MNNTVDPDNLTPKAPSPDLLEWRKKCTINGDMFFGPFDGICGSCGGDLVEHYNKTGVAVPTGCPLCNRSFVE